MSTKPCPWCNEEIPAVSRVCRHCGTPVVQRCAACLEEIAVRAGRCPKCGADLALAGPEKEPPPPRPEAAASGPEARVLGEERGLFVTLVLSVLTCGIYQMVVLYSMGCELNAHHGRGRLRPGLDLLLTFLTCGFWSIYVMYRYPATLREITEDEGGPRVDIVLPCLLFMVGTYLVPPLYFVGPLLLQDELNAHWKRHREGVAA